MVVIFSRVILLGVIFFRMIENDGDEGFGFQLAGAEREIVVFIMVGSV